MLEIATKPTLPKKPLLITTLPGPQAKELVERDRAVTSPYGISKYLVYIEVVMTFLKNYCVNEM